jgi:hypothetical protein
MEDFMLKTLLTLVAAGAFAALLVPAAQAFTPAPLSISPDVIQVAGGCGRGFHRGPQGGCRPNHGRPVVVCKRVFVAGAAWRRVCR